MELENDKQDNHACSVPFRAACGDDIVVTPKEAACYVYQSLVYYATMLNVPVLAVMKAVETKALEEFGNG